MKDNIKNTPSDVYSVVTNRIIEHLEKGVIPWRQTWAKAGLPKNLITGKNYRGINVWLLNSLNYSQNSFLTFKQVKDLGGSVKKGEKAQEVVFWKWIEKENKETKDIEKVPLLKYYRVFNIDQCIDIPKEKLPPVIERNNNPIDTCEKIINEMPKQPDIRFKEHRAYYNRIDDFVNMPKMETFENSQEYYATLFHELVHSTGHNDRLNRKELLESAGMRSDKYAMEELTAEMGASYLKSYAGIPIEHLENNAAYIQGWLERLKNDKRFIVHASAQAQKATDYILNMKDEEKELGLNQDIEKEDKHIDKEKLIRETLDSEKKRYMQLQKSRSERKTKVKEINI
jgi:antirestriction protein ArdC